MSENTKKNNIKNEQSLIYLLLHKKEAIEFFINKGLTPEHFSQKHKSIILFILELYENENVLLTRKSFKDKIKHYKSPKDRISQELSFSACFVAKAKMDNIPLLVNKVLENSIQKSVNKALDDFKKNQNSRGQIFALKELSDFCDNILVGVDTQQEKSYFDDIRKLSEDRIQYISDIRSGKIKKEPRILTGIKEIDDTMVTGLEKGTLTLIIAEVGCFKSTMLLNIGLNVWKSDNDVLFVPLEMHRDQMWVRACSRDARIPSELIIRGGKDLTEKQLNKIKMMKKEWDSRSSNFFIMQEPGYTTVTKIKKQIERNIDILKPKLVVIDYVANLETERNRYGRNDLEIGDMLKSMRQMGKDLGFSVLSAAQIGRDALKRLRKAGVNRDKPSVHSEDIRGSHEYAADADNIYAQLKSTAQPNELLDIYVVKARNGKTTFDGGSCRATLSIYPEFGLIKSQTDFEQENDEEMDEILGGYIDGTKTDKDIISKSKFFDEDEMFDENDNENDNDNSSDKDIEEIANEINNSDW